MNIAREVEVLKGRAILWGVSLSIILVVLAAGIESNAVSYWIDQGNNLFNQGNYQGARYCYNKAIGLGNQTNAPIFTKIITHCGYSMDAIDQNNRTLVFSKICAEPTNSIKGQPNLNPENLTLGFDVSNPNGMHMRISNIYVNVIKYNSIFNPKIIQNFAKGYNRGYSCSIKPAIGSSKCILTLTDYDFIDLAPNELEHIVINVGADTPGAYELGISLDYAIGSTTNKITVEDVTGIISFFDSSLTSEAE